MRPINIPGVPLITYEFLPWPLTPTRSTGGPKVIVSSQRRSPPNHQFHDSRLATGFTTSKADQILLKDDLVMNVFSSVFGTVPL